MGGIEYSVDNQECSREYFLSKIADASDNICMTYKGKRLSKQEFIKLVKKKKHHFGLKALQFSFITPEYAKKCNSLPFGRFFF